MTKRVNIDLDKEVIKILKVDAIEKDTVFKTHLETMLTNYANKIKSKKS